MNTDASIQPNAGTTDRPSRPAGRIDLEDPNAVSAWREYFGITVTQLEEAVKAAGTDGDAVHEHLLNQGASAGAG